VFTELVGNDTMPTGQITREYRKNHAFERAYISEFACEASKSLYISQKRATIGRPTIMKDESAEQIWSIVTNNKGMYLEKCGIKGTDEKVLYLKIVGQDDKVLSLKIK